MKEGAHRRTGIGIGLLLWMGLLLLLPAPAWAKRAKEKDPRLEALWRQYQEIRKVSDIVPNRERTRIAGEIASLGTEAALKRLLEILRKDPAINPQLAALRGLCAKGGPDVLKKTVVEAKKDRDCLSLWLGTLLGQAEHAEAGTWVLEKSRLLRSPKTAIHAVEALGALRVVAARDALLEVYEKHRKSKRHAPLVYETVRALGRIGTPCLRPVILDAALSGTPWERRAAAASLLTFADEDGDIRLVMRKLLTAPDGLVREAAVKAVGRAKAEAYVPQLIERLSDERLRVRPLARGALTTIAGADLGGAPATWTSWWQRQSAGQQACEASRTVAREEDDRIPSNGVMLLLDISKSNTWQKPSMPNRIDVAKARIVELIGRLHESSTFNVMAVCGSIRVWHEAKGRDGGMVPATEKNRKSAIQWVRKLECRTYTDTWTALEKTIEDYPAVDTVFYVTDGALRLGVEVYWEELPMRVKALNRLRDVIIHVRYLRWGSVMQFAVEHDDLDEQRGWLEPLALENGGTFELQTAP